MKIAVVANGEWDQEWGRVELSAYEMIIAADGGAKHIMQSGFFPHALIGDLDSIDSEILELCRQKGIPIISYPSQKDETDLELACMYGMEVWQKAKDERAKGEGIPEITLLGGTGGRIDHLLGNLALLLKFWRQGYRIRMKDSIHDIYLVEGKKNIQGYSGQTLSIIPVSSKAKVYTEGLYYPLHGEYLYQDTPRGISNILVGSEAEIEVSEGIVLVVQLQKNL